VLKVHKRLNVSKVAHQQAVTVVGKPKGQELHDVFMAARTTDFCKEEA